MDDENNKSCYYKLLKPLLIIVFLIIFYVSIFYIFKIPKNYDPLLFEPSVPYLTKYLGGWTLLHFVAFAIIGSRYPNCFESAMVYGALWEFLEFSLGEFIPIFFPKFAHRIDPTWTLWYYGRYPDIIMNFLGFLFGRYFS